MFVQHGICNTRYAMKCRVTKYTIKFVYFLRFAFEKCHYIRVIQDMQKYALLMFTSYCSIYIWQDYMVVNIELFYVTDCIGLIESYPEIYQLDVY
jgi:hypothetical protein